MIKEVTVTEINKRKIDIKKAEPKTANSYQPIPGKPIMGGEATIPCYGDQQKSRSPSRENYGGRGHHENRGGGEYRGG